MITMAQTDSNKLSLSLIVNKLCSINRDIDFLKKIHEKNRLLPSRDVIVNTVEKIRSILFPGYFGNSE